MIRRVAPCLRTATKHSGLPPTSAEYSRTRAPSRDSGRDLHHHLTATRGPEVVGAIAISTPMRSESDGAHEVVDLAIAFPVDDPARLPLCRTAGGTRQPGAGVAVLDRLDVPEVPGEAVELGPGGAQDGTASLRPWAIGATFWPKISRNTPRPQGPTVTVWFAVSLFVQQRCV